MKGNEGQKEVFSRKEAARFLSVSISFLEKLMREKKIPYSKINGKVLFMREDLIEWLKQNRVVSPRDLHRKEPKK